MTSVYLPLFLAASALYLVTPAAVAAQNNKPAAQQPGHQQTGHQPTQQAKAAFIADYDQNLDGKVSQAEFFSVRQQRLAQMDLQHNAQIRAEGYQAEYVDRLDRQLHGEREAQLKQTQIRIKALDKNQDGVISAAEYQQSGDSAFAMIDRNKDAVISKADEKQQQPRQQGRRSMLNMPTTHSVTGMLLMYDADGNAEVSQQEYLAKRQQVFAYTDLDKNGVLSGEEYLVEFTDRVDRQLEKNRTAALKQALVRFNALDKDQNQILSAAEYHQSGKNIFQRFDSNKDFVVSKQDALPEAATTAETKKPAQVKQPGQTAQLQP